MTSCVLAIQASADAIISILPIHVVKVDPVAQIVELFGPKKYMCSFLGLIREVIWHKLSSTKFSSGLCSSNSRTIRSQEIYDTN